MVFCVLSALFDSSIEIFLIKSTSSRQDLASTHASLFEHLRGDYTYIWRFRVVSLHIHEPWKIRVPNHGQILSTQLSLYILLADT